MIISVYGSPYFEPSGIRLKSERIKVATLSRYDLVEGDGYQLEEKDRISSITFYDTPPIDDMGDSENLPPNLPSWVFDCSLYKEEPYLRHKFEQSNPEEWRSGFGGANRYLCALSHYLRTHNDTLGGPDGAAGRTLYADTVYIEFAQYPIVSSYSPSSEYSNVDEQKKVYQDTTLKSVGYRLWGKQDFQVADEINKQIESSRFRAKHTRG